MRPLSIRPLTRVEGAGEVLLQLEGERLCGVQLRIDESPRLFESLLCGRHVEEIPALVSRICAICSVPHALVAILALEKAVGVTPPATATLVRELALLGNLVQSHALHLFALVLPDQRGCASLLDLLRDGDATAAEGVALKQFGNRVQELAGGRLIHPITLQLGGVLASPGETPLQEISSEARRWQERLPRWGAHFVSTGHAGCGEALGVPLAVAGGGALALWGDVLRGGEAVLPVTDYRRWLHEQSVETSQAKQVCAPQGFWRVGALARRQLSPDPAPPPGRGIYANNTAQLQELELALARIVEVAEALRRQASGALLRATPQVEGGSGAVALEAPRGTLIHHYGVDDTGRVVTADIITPTTINQVAIEAQLFADLCGGSPPEQLCQHAEEIVRAFDPCISCAVHLIRT